jgi:hypothetical protein
MFSLSEAGTADGGNGKLRLQAVERSVGTLRTTKQGNGTMVHSKPCLRANRRSFGSRFFWYPIDLISPIFITPSAETKWGGLKI